MSSITILGTGNMARGIATRALAGGNDVQILGRDGKKAAELAAELGAGAGTGSVTAGTIGEPITGDIVVLAVPYPASVSLTREQAAALDGKIIVDIANPVDPDTYDRLVTPPDSSAPEEVAKVAPAGAKVVKAFNTTFAPTLVAGQVSGQQLDVFIAGDDADAKAAVGQLAESGGLRPLDVGPLNRARYLDGLGFLHIGLQMTRGTQFNTAVKLVE